MLPQPNGTLHYHRIPFNFTESLTASNVFQPLPSAFSPTERMVLQAPGNLQRLLSGFFNMPSRVEIVYNEMVPCEQQSTPSDIKSQSNLATPPDTPTCTATTTNKFAMQFVRKIAMYFGDRLVYEADSVVVPQNNETLDLLAVHHYGLGQIFSHLQRAPDFALHAVGRHGDQPGCSFWRDYSLSAPGALDCYIREIFVENMLDEGGHQSTSNSSCSATSRGACSSISGTIWYNAADDPTTDNIL